MRSKVRSKRQISKLRSQYGKRRDREPTMDIGSHLATKSMLDPKNASHFRKSTTKEARRLMAKRGVTDFGFGVLRNHVHTYVRLFPHTMMGRYPTRLADGKLTTDIYESQENSVLYSLYVTIPHNYGILCGEASRLDKLCELGHGTGYW